MTAFCLIGLLRIVSHRHNHTMSEFQLYLQEEGPAAAARVRQKILAAAGAAAIGSTAWAIAGQRPVGRTALGVTANTAIAMTTFAVCQEGVRAARGGRHDAWNSFAAGALTGAAWSRATHGRGFHLLGAVLWGPMCGALHWAGQQLQLGLAMREWLADNGLLDLPPEYYQKQKAAAEEAASQLLQQQAAAAAAAATAVQPTPRRFEDLSDREKRAAVEEIKQRELAELHARLKRQERTASAAGAAGTTRDDAADTRKRGRWWLLGW